MHLAQVLVRMRMLHCCSRMAQMSTHWLVPTSWDCWRVDSLGGCQLLCMHWLLYWASPHSYTQNETLRQRTSCWWLPFHQDDIYWVTASCHARLRGAKNPMFNGWTTCDVWVGKQYSKIWFAAQNFEVSRSMLEEWPATSRQMGICIHITQSKHIHYWSFSKNKQTCMLTS